MENNTPLIQYTTVSDSVYLWIKNAIIQGDFKPGEHIAQETLTKKLGVSRTPVRDAIKRLEAEAQKPVSAAMQRKSRRRKTHPSLMSAITEHWIRWCIG